MSVDRRVPGPGWSDRDLTGEPALYICFADFDFSAQNSKSGLLGPATPVAPPALIKQQSHDRLEDNDKDHLENIGDFLTSSNA